MKTIKELGISAAQADAMLTIHWLGGLVDGGQLRSAKVRRPTVDALERKGLVETDMIDGRFVAVLTTAGEAVL